MYYHDPKGRLTKELARGERTRTFWRDNMLLSIVEFDAYSWVPDHTHSHEQRGMLLEGGLEMSIAEEGRQPQPGDVFIIPGNVEHRAGSGSSPARVLDIFSPV